MIRLRTAALGLAILAGSATFAGAQTTRADSARPEARQDRGDRSGRKAMKARGNRGMRALFRGVQLTAEQRTQVRTIAEKYQPQRKSLMEAMRPAMTDARAARQRGDTAAAKAAFDRTADSRAKLAALREQQLREVRGILTAAQQQTFDRNVAQAKEKMEKRKGRAGRRA